MRRRSVGSIGFALVAAMLPALALSACSSSLGGMGSYGSARLEVASVPGIESYSAPQALGEARNHFRNSDFGYSAALYKRVVELSPRDPQGYVGLGASYDRLGRFDLSDRVYATLFKLTGGTVQYYNNVGYSYMLRGDLQNAMQSFRKARELDPGNVVVANNLHLMVAAARA